MGASSSTSAQRSGASINPYVIRSPMVLVFSLRDGSVEVRDMAGTVSLTAEVSSRSLRGRKVVLHEGDFPVVSMQEKLTSGRSRWQAFQVPRSGTKRKWFSVRKVSASRSETELDVFLANSRRENVRNYRITGSYDDRTCLIYKGNSTVVVAQMNSELPKDMPQEQHLFNVRINASTNEEVDYCFIAALSVGLREVHRRPHVLIRIVKRARKIAGVAVGIIGVAGSVTSVISTAGSVTGAVN